MIVLLKSFVPGWLRRFVATMVELITPSNRKVRSRWLRAPQLERGDNVCIFVSYASDSVMPAYSRFQARAWSKAGFRLIIVLNTDSFGDDPRADELDFASGILLRENRGYDFGAWATALQAMPAVRTASSVALANDSMYGPLDTFEPMLDRMRALDADLIGAVESLEFGRHFQSFLLIFSHRALNSDAFWNFWGRIKAGGRLIAVYRYELGVMRTMERAGMRCTALFTSHDNRNPTLTRWRELIQEGLPYLKIALLRDNLFKADLSGWQKVLQDHGYDTGLATQHDQKGNAAGMPRADKVLTGSYE